MSERRNPERASWIAVALVAAALVGAGSAAADVVRLKNGQSLEGEATEAGGQVKVHTAGGTIGFPAELVARIERGDSVERLATKRLQALAPNDVEGRVELALELEDAGATTLAQRIFESVLERDPDHPTARHALGYVLCDDEWTSDEDCHRRHGQVLYQGEWMSSDQRSALESLAQARRVSELERLRAQIQIESARLAADREAAAMSYGSMDGYGYPYDPYYYGGGVPYYPVYGYGGLPGRSPIRGGGRLGNDGRFPGGGRGFDHGRQDGRFGQPGRDGARRFEGGVHHAGGQPARPLTPQHSSNTLAPPR